MTNSLIALALFIVILGAIAVFFGRRGKLKFWKLAAELPNYAFEWFTNDPAWIIILADEPTPGENYVGPFFLFIPLLGKTIKLFAHEDQIEESQQRFLEHYKELLPDRKFPYLSAFAMLYPIAAMLWMSKTPASPVIILGYGLSNLGYLLGVAFIFPGHFRILSLDYRIPTLIAAIIFWLIGVVLSNFPT